MHRERDDRERDHRDLERDPLHERNRDREYVRDVRERDRFPPPPGMRGSFMHGLPPLNLSNPRGYFPSSPGVAVSGRGDLPPPGGDHSGWGGGSRPGLAPAMGGSPAVGEMRPRWSPQPPSTISPKHRTFGDRLPSMNMMDYSPPVSAGSGSAPPLHPSGPPVHHWDPPPPPLLRDHSRDDVNSVGGGGGGGSGSGPGPHVGGLGAADMYDDSAATSSRSSATKHAVPPGEDDQPRKKKRRQAFSCNECAKRKQKCNRQTPCQHCVSRKVEHLCISAALARQREEQGVAAGIPLPTTPIIRTPKIKTESSDRITAVTQDGRPTSSSGNPSLSVRVNKLEKMMNAIINRVDGLDSTSLTEWRLHHPIAKSPPPERPSLDPLGGTHVQSGSSGLSGDSWMEETAQSASAEEPQPPTQLGLRYSGTVCEHLEHIVEDGPAPTLQRSLQDLPAKEFADQLVDFYFDHINHLRYPIDQKLFTRAYDAAYASRNGGSTASVAALPLIFAVLAISMRFAPVDWAGPEDTRRKRSLKLFWGAQFGLMISMSVNAENLQLVEARILLGLYLILVHDRRLTEAWLMIRSAVDTAVAVGLHRDDPRLRVDPYLTEYRARLWSYLCHADATLSFSVGRPLTIDPATYDVHTVNNINLSDLVELNTAGGALPEIPSRPLTDATFATYVIFRKRLAEIVARMVKMSQEGRSDDYDVVKAIDADFTAFHDSLPTFFKFENPDKSYDKVLRVLPVHRYYLQAEILHYVMALHRPWFLRQLRKTTYKASRQRMWQTAVLSFEIRERFLVENPRFVETNLGTSTREFNLAVIVAFGLLIDPKSEQASKMKQILSRYAERHPVDEGDTSDPEASIARLLYKRASGIKTQRSPRAGSVPLASPQHPLDNFSSERERGHPSVSRGGSANGTADPSPKINTSTAVGPNGAQGLRTPASESSSGNDDQVQALYDMYMAATSQSGKAASSGYPSDYSPLASSSLLGVLGVGPPPLSHSTISTVDGPTSGLGLITETLSKSEVSTIVYWNNLVDIMVEHVGQA